ncbi:nuclear formin-like protein [Plasmodium sp. DRC-Itaito]|nr:nuclear formin-like protein [Plasmodium sp. DRC-Itaito]
MAPDTLLNKYICKFQKINDKLLELLNKYRYAYFKTLDVIIYYEGLVKRNVNLFDDKELSELYKRKRQCEECILEEEREIRKILNMGKDNNIMSTNYTKDYNINAERDNIKEENVDVVMNNEPVVHTKDNNDMINHNTSCIVDINEKNKSNYVDLGTLDFSAYKEDSEGCIQYCENKEDVETQKQGSTQQVEEKRHMKVNSSRYESQHGIKNRNILKQSVYVKQNNNMKSVSSSKYVPNKSVINIDKSFKITHNRNYENLSKKSIYNNNNNNNNNMNSNNIISNNMNSNNINSNNIMNKMCVGGINKKVAEKKIDVHKSTYIGSNNKLLNNMNRSIYIGAKKNINSNNININNNGNTYNNIHNYKKSYDNNISLLCAHKNTMGINKEKDVNDTGTNKNANSYKNVTNEHTQNSLYIKKNKSFNTLNNSIYVKKNICQNSIYNKSNTIIYNGKKRKTNENEKEEEKDGNKNNEMICAYKIKEYNEYNNSDERNKNNKLTNNIINKKLVNKEDNKIYINNDISKNISLLYDNLNAYVPITLGHIKNLIEYDDTDWEVINKYIFDKIFDLKDANNTGENIAHLKDNNNKGENISDLKDANNKGENIVHLKDANNTGENISHLKDANNTGENISHLKDANNTGKNISHLKDANNTGKNISHLKDANNTGKNISHLKDANNTGKNISHLKHNNITLEGINLQCDKIKCFDKMSEKTNENVDTYKNMHSIYKGDNMKGELYIKEEKCIIQNINNKCDDKKSYFTKYKNIHICESEISSCSNVCESNEQDECSFVREMDNVNLDRNNQVDIKKINDNNSNIPIEYVCENIYLQNNQKDVDINDENKLKIDKVSINKVIKESNDDISLKYKNIIFNINDEIKKKVKKEKNEETNEDVESLSKLCNKPSNIKNVPFPSSLRKNILLESEERKSQINNRFQLHLDLNVDVRYITLNMIDIDDTINKGVYPYKDIEDNYISSEEHIKDIIKYSDILKIEKQTYLYYPNDVEKYDYNDDNINNVRKTLDTIIQFKSSKEIKNDIIKLVGISIFDCINKSYEPTKSLINDENLSIWFTKREKNKNKNDDMIINNMRGNILELNYTQDKELLFEKRKEKKKIFNKRLSNMGYFSQAVVIMLCSLKRQNEYKSLKKIISSIILCTCDSSCLEKFLHTIPQENSKNYTLWKETLNKLTLYFGQNRCDEVVEKLMIIKEDEYMNESKERCRLKNDYYEGDNIKNNKNKYNHNDDEKDIREYCKFDNDMKFFDDHMNNSSFPFECKEKEKKKKYNDDDNEQEEIYEDEQFCLFICRIKNVHKRFGYLLLIENFDFVYKDLLKNIRNKLSSIQLILNKHILLKQLFCNILYICNWLNKPKKYEWFEWNLVVKKLKKLYGYSENGRISKERCIMLILAKHTGEIFTDKELYFLKKISTFYIKDLYDKCIDFINTYLEIRNEIDTEEFIDSCCIHNLKNDIKENNIYDHSCKYYLHDKFLEIVKKFVQTNYDKILYIIWNIVLLIKQYLVIIFWFNDIRPFFPLFNYVNEDNKQKKLLQDFFVNFVHFFENYNKYIDILKKENVNNKMNDKIKNTFNDTLCDIKNININMGSADNEHNILENNYYVYTNNNMSDESTFNVESKKRKSLTNTIDYACLLKRKSAQHKETMEICKRSNSGKFSDVEFESSD